VGGLIDAGAPDAPRTFVDPDGGNADGGARDGDARESDPTSADANDASDANDAKDTNETSDAGEIDGASDDAGAVCESPLSLCDGACVDLGIDPSNCGACGTFCPSGLCNGGKCRGAKAGHFVTIGHDFSGVSTASAAAQVVFGAVFLPSTNPVRVLSFDEWADASSGGAVENVEKILGAATAGRTWSETRVSSEAGVLSKLSIDAFDVLLVYDQPKAPDGALGKLGADLAAQMLSFGRSGGVVVVLDGGTGIAQMDDFLNAGGILSVKDERTASGRELENLAPGDAVGIDVLSSYLAPTNSVGFTLDGPASTDRVIVIDEKKSGRPVVVHEVVRKP
jgi:hypothetical protein